MRSLILYTAVSLDGLIARPNGSVDWLDAYAKDPDGSDYGYADFIAGIDTTMMGNATFLQSEKLGGMAAMAPFENFVFTRTKNRPAGEFVSFISEDIQGFVRNQKKKEGRNIWLLGGGQINTLLLGAKLVDEMILTTVPIILGKGIPLFAPRSSESAFSLKKSKIFSNGLVQLTYARKTS